MVYIIQKGSRCYLSPIEEAKSKPDQEDMLLRGNQKSTKPDLKTADLGKSINKEV